MSHLMDSFGHFDPFCSWQYFCIALGEELVLSAFFSTSLIANKVTNVALSSSFSSRRSSC